MPDQEHIDNSITGKNAPSENGHLQPPALEDIRSEEVTEIIGKMPHWIIRRGITIISFLVLLILTGAYFFKYPDIIPARVTISSGNPPVKLVAKNSLPIQTIFVKNEDAVKKDQILCVFSNAAVYNDVMKVNEVVRHIDTGLDFREVIKSSSFPSGLQLGELQSNYIELYQTLQAYKFFLQHNAYDATIGSLSSQIQYSSQLQAEQSKRQQLQQQQLAMQQRQFAADSVLLHAKIISRVEFEESKRKMLDQEMNAGNNNTGAIQNKLQQSEYAKNIALTTVQKQSEENDLLQKTRDAIRRFQGAFAGWEQNYVLKSPADGKVSFFNVWKENQFIAAGEGIMMIIPPAADFMARGTVGPNRYGRIKPGQKVLLKLQAYPYEEYGMLEATLTARTMVPMDDNYAIEMKLKSGLMTNSGKLIPPSPTLLADAEIVTDDKSVLSRLFEKVIGKVK